MKLQKKDVIFYARILEPVGVYEVEELVVRAIHGTWFSAIEKRSKRAYLFPYSSIGKELFLDREEALSKVLDAEQNKKIVVSDETDNDIYE